MRQLLFLFLFLLSGTLFSEGQITIGGKIKNAAKDTVFLVNDPFYLGQNSQNQYCCLKQDSFFFNLKSQGNAFLNLIFHGQVLKIYVDLDGGLFVEAQANSFMESIKFSGKNASENVFLKDFNKQFTEEFTVGLMEDKIKTTSVDAFEMDLYANKKKQLDVFKAASSNSKFSDEFKKAIENTIKYTYLNYLFAYPIVNGNNSKGLTVTPLPKNQCKSLYL